MLDEIVLHTAPIDYNSIDSVPVTLPTPSFGGARRLRFDVTRGLVC